MVIAYPEPFLNLYWQFEAYCVGACCGYEAYDINAWRVLEWMTDGGSPDQLLTALDQLDGILETLAGHRGSVADGELVWSGKSESTAFYATMQAEMLRALCHVNGPAVFDPRWLVANGRAVEALARQMSDRGRYETAGILADALEEVGCESPELLTRCRQSRVRANWVVQLLLLGADGEFNRPIEPTPERRTSPAPVAQ